MKKYQVVIISKNMDISGMIKILDTIASRISKNTRVLPGHREFFSGSFILASLDYLKELHRRIKSAIKQNLSLEETKNKLLKQISRKGLEQVAHWEAGKNVDEIFLQNIQTAWALLKK